MTSATRQHHAAATEAFQERLGHSFADPGLLRSALTHASRETHDTNERIEFLGDRVLGLVIADSLYDRFDVAEGKLAPWLNALVRRETCAAVAQDIGLPAALRLSRSEDETGGREKPAILADAMEAVIGAVFKDAGYAAARSVVLRHWQGHIDRVASVPLDAKTLLQEWSQARARGIPTYEVVGRSGPDHAPEFTIAVAIPGVGTADGKGASKRAAEQAAAAALLAQVKGDDG